jgi:hypothetical protein
MATPADAIVGTVTALAAMHRPSNIALREAFIQYSFFNFVRPLKQPNLFAKRDHPIFG